MLNLVVHSPFGGHLIGDLITDAEEVAKIVGTDIERFVTKIESAFEKPKPAPAPAESPAA